MFRCARDGHGCYSEDIDRVQIDSGAIGPILDAIRVTLYPWLGEPKRKQSQGRVTMIYRFETTIRPIQTMRLKVEINTRDHFSVLGVQRQPFVVDNHWFSGNADITSTGSMSCSGPSCARLLPLSNRDIMERIKGALTI